MAQLPEPVFIDDDPNVIVAEMIATFEAATGLTLSPAQVERIQINGAAYRESLVRSGVNTAAKYNLVAFAPGVILDYLGQLVGVIRLTAQPAQCDIEFTLVTGHGDVVIPRGTRVASQDGQAVFRTKTDTPVDSGDDDVTVACECETDGVVGNGYIAGNVSVILDPQAYLSTAANIATTAGGADKETDEQLRVRIMLAPASFSTAGSDDGYKYFARTASPSIIDVEVFSSMPGTVDVYPLTMESGGTSEPILDAVRAILVPKKNRPLNDEVVVTSPAPATYSIEVDLELFDDANPTETLALAQQAAQAFADTRRRKLGRDIVVDQLKGVIILPNIVYKATVTEPSSDMVLDKTQYAECTGIIINITGFNNG